MAVDYEAMTSEELIHIWIEVRQGRGHHGDFLRAFADAFNRADRENEEILREAAVKLVKKYKLVDYLDNFHG